MSPITKTRCWHTGVSLAALLGLASLLAWPVAAAELPSYTGFTRPGTPNDSLADGKVIPAVDPQGVDKVALGGTVYFMVLERGADDTDPWGAGLKELLTSFRTGVDYQGDTSPTLDTAAKYLYLYQVVNDRRPAAPIENVSIKLLVEMKDITSWGYFTEVDFATSETRKEGKEIAIRPVSYTNVVAPSEEAKAYKSPAKPVTLPKLKLTRGKAQPAVDKGKIITILWDPLDPATDPTNVMILGKSQTEDLSFRAIFSGKRTLTKGQRSTVFGFTSNLPPKMEAVFLRTPREFQKEKGGIVPAKGSAVLDQRPLELAGDVPELILAQAQPGDPADGVIAAQGEVPTPTPETTPAEGAPPAAPFLPAAAAPLAPGGGLTGGGVSGGPAGAPAGALGFARAGVTGSVIASGGGQGQAQQDQQLNQAGQQTINFNATLLNQQAQAQAQAQAQHQHQSQAGHVIPGPAAWLLTLLGLPALWLCGRRQLKPVPVRGR